VDSGKTILASIKTGHTRVEAVVYSPDTGMLATAGFDESFTIGLGHCSVKVWDAKTEKLITTLNGHTDTVSCLAWGAELISGSADHWIRVWNTSTWEQIICLDEHSAGVTAIAIYDRILASASHDKTARLWNLDNGQPISSPLKHADTVSCVSFSADGQLVATGCHDHNVYAWTIIKDTSSRAARRSRNLKYSNDGDNPLSDADATQHSVQQVKDATEVSLEWLQTLRGQDWLRTRMGRDWLQTQGGQYMLQTERGREWLRRDGKDWLETPGGQDWLQTQGGQDWLQLPDGQDWLQTQERREPSSLHNPYSPPITSEPKWQENQGGQVWPQGQFSAYDDMPPLTEARMPQPQNGEWLGTRPGQAWQNTQGRRELVQPGSWRDWLSSREWLQTQAGQDWLQTEAGKDWLNGPNGQDWLQTLGGRDWLQTQSARGWLQSQSGRDWLWTQGGRGWLQTQGGRDWLNASSGQIWLQTQNGRDWLQTQGGRDWLDASDGQDWLQTQSGRDWLQIRNGRDWLQSRSGQDWLQTQNGRDWLRTQCARDWLQTQSGRDWLRSQGGRGWLQTQGGRDLLQTQGGRDWLDTSSGQDWLQTQSGQEWLLAQGGQDWLQTQSGRDWLQRLHGQAWQSTFASWQGRSQPDADVAPHVSPRPWLGFFSRRAPNPRAAAQKDKLRHTAQPPNTRAATQAQPKQDHSQAGAPSLSPLPLNLHAAVATTTPPLMPPPLAIGNLTIIDTPDAPKRQAGCWTRFWSCSCCTSTKSSDGFH